MLSHVAATGFSGHWLEKVLISRISSDRRQVKKGLPEPLVRGRFPALHP
jgi:hypothetical protein